MAQEINDTKHQNQAYKSPTGHLHIANCVHVALISENVHNRRTKQTQDTCDSHNKHVYVLLTATVF